MNYFHLIQQIVYSFMIKYLKLTNAYARKYNHKNIEQINNCGGC